MIGEYLRVDEVQGQEPVLPLRLDGLELSAVTLVSGAVHVQVHLSTAEDGYVGHFALAEDDLFRVRQFPFQFEGQLPQGFAANVLEEGGGSRTSCG